MREIAVQAANDTNNTNGTNNFVPFWRDIFHQQNVLFLIEIGFFPEKKQSTRSKSRLKTLKPLFFNILEQKSMLIRPSLWPLSYTSMSLLEMGVEPTTKGLLCMLYSPTEIRTPDGWFKVISDNHFTIGEGDHKSSKNNSEHVFLPNLPNKPTTHHHDYDSLRRGRNPNWFYVR